MSASFSFARTLLLAAGLLCSAGGALAQGTPQPLNNPVTVSDPSALPADIAEQLIQMGASSPIPALNALYTPLFPAGYLDGLRVSRDIAYGPAPRNVLDVMAPAGGAGGLPVLIFVHGGGFGAGNKSAPNSPFYDNIPYWAASHGLVGVNVNYRYAPDAPWPAGIEDLRAVIAWVKENIAKHGGDPARVYLWGKSTGAAHVVDYLADVAEKGEAEQVAGAILTSGFYVLGDTPAWENYYGSDVSLYPERNALPGLLASNTPLLATYAEFDADQYRTQFNLLLNAMNAAGKPLRTLYLRGHNHISETYAVGTSDESLSGPVLDFILHTPGAAKPGAGPAGSEPNAANVPATELSAIPADILERLQAMGDRPDTPALQQLYAPLFKAPLFAGMNRFRDLAYGPDERNRLDVVSKGVGLKDRPVLVFVHGGGFGAGNKNSTTTPFYDNIPYWAAENGLIGVNVNYRFAPGHAWPAGIEDMRALVAWLQANIADFGGDPDKLFFWGKSTGASHVADYLADLARKGETSPLAGAVFTSGFYALGDEPAWENYYGSDTSLYAERSALPRLVRSETPLFATYAEYDGAMYHEQFALLRAAMAEAGRPLRTLQLRGHNHMSETFAVGTKDRSLSDPVLKFVRDLSRTR